MLEVLGISSSEAREYLGLEYITLLGEAAQQHTSSLIPAAGRAMGDRAMREFRAEASALIEVPFHKAGAGPNFLEEDTITALWQQHEYVKQLWAINRHQWTEHGLVFPSRTGTPYGESGLGKTFRTLCQTLAVTPIRVYDLRSTWASNALEAGVDIKVVSERLGHSDVRFTLQVYVRTVEAQHRKAALDTQALYGSKPDLSTKTIEVKAQPVKKNQALPRARKTLPKKAPKNAPKKASATKLPPEGK